MGKVIKQRVEYGGSSNSAENIKYDDTKNVKTAIDEVKSEVSTIDGNLNEFNTNLADNTTRIDNVESELSTKATKYTNKGSATQPIYIDSDGVPQSISYTIGKSVPSDAKFTDTTYTHPTTSGNKHIPSGGSSGQILRWIADGTAVWGADNNTDTKNTAGTTNKTGSKLFLAGATSQAVNPQTYSNSNVYIGTDNELYSAGKKVAHQEDVINLGAYISSGWKSNMAVSSNGTKCTVASLTLNAGTYIIVAQLASGSGIDAGYIDIGTTNITTQKINSPSDDGITSIAVLTTTTTVSLSTRSWSSTTANGSIAALRIK